MTQVATTQKRRNLILGIVGGVIVLLLMLAIVFDAGPEGETGQPVLTGEGLPRFEATQNDSAIGLPAPEVTGEGVAGGTVDIDPGGTPVALVFLAHWCSHCQAEVPRVQQWLDAGGGVDGVEIIGVSTAINSARDNYPPSQWLEREGWAAPVLKDDPDGTVHATFGGGGFPYWVFVDADGNVAARSSGELDIATLEQFMQGIAE